MALRADHVPSAKQDDRHVGLRASESLGYFGLGHRAAESADFGDFFAGQQLLEARNATDVDGVLSVHSIIDPFQVSGSGIPFNAIDVINHRQVVRVWDESQSHQSVNVYRLALSVSEKIDVRVAEFVDTRPQNLSVYSSGLQAVADAVQTSDAADIAHLVEISEVRDRNRSPFFSESAIHLTGRLSGDVGSMIKDPSHASTFGGSAIMASTSDFYNGRLRFL